MKTTNWGIGLLFPKDESSLAMNIFLTIKRGFLCFIDNFLSAVFVLFCGRGLLTGEVEDDAGEFNRPVFYLGMSQEIC